MRKRKGGGRRGNRRIPRSFSCGSVRIAKQYLNQPTLTPETSNPPLHHAFDASRHIEREGERGRERGGEREREGERETHSM